MLPDMNCCPVGKLVTAGALILAAIRELQQTGRRLSTLGVGTGWFSPSNVRIASDGLQCFALKMSEFTEQAIKSTRGFLLAKLHKWRSMAQHRFRAMRDAA
jgi:hypothetical protein